MSLVVCFLARGIYDSDVITNALGILGYDMNPDDLLKIGGVTLREKYNFKIREGFNPESIIIPRRIFQTPIPHGMISEDLVKRGVKSALNRLSNL